jgi:hypothetical protein
MSMEMPWTSGNGGFPGLFAFSACQLEMISSSLVELSDSAISNVQRFHPYGDRLQWTSAAGPGRRARRWSAQKA